MDWPVASSSRHEGLLYLIRHTHASIAHTTCNKYKAASSYHSETTSRQSESETSSHQGDPPSRQSESESTTSQQDDSLPISGTLISIDFTHFFHYILTLLIPRFKADILVSANAPNDDIDQLYEEEEASVTMMIEPTGKKCTSLSVISKLIIDHSCDNKL